ncbi:MAG: RNA-binding S4 domain-containing protein [Pseudomonadota bacterium]|nr:RNA-binding S4 domain-containing protein [Pseudomonadota bacterium]
MTIDTIRIDQWLWFARFLKSRSLATKLCLSGKIRVNGELISKAHRKIRQGDVLTFPLNRDIRVIRIQQLSGRRGPSKEAQTLYEDLNPPRSEHQVGGLGRHLPFEQRKKGSGRPTKSNRRAVDRLMGN